ncbi:hypothetical protein ACFX19_012036 [Malus domestica]
MHSSSVSKSLSTSRASNFLETVASSALRFVHSPAYDNTTSYIPCELQSHQLSPTSYSTQYLIHVDPNFQHEQLCVVLPIPMNVHPMQTRAKNKVLKKKAFSTTATLEPKRFKAASKVSEWQNAIEKEIAAFHSQKTWFLV